MIFNCAESLSGPSVCGRVASARHRRRRAVLKAGKWLSGVSALAVALSIAGATAEPPRTDRLRQLHALAESTHHPAWKLALRQQAYQVARAMPGELEGAQLLVAHRWLGLLLRMGMTDRAAAVFASVPIHLRDSVLAHPSETAAANGLPVSWDFADLRFEMAAALVLEDRRDLARQLINDAASVSGEDDDARSLVAMLVRCLEPSETDPFDLFVDILETAVRDSLVESVTWRRLFASRAAHDGYAPLARYQYLSAARDLDYGLSFHTRDLESHRTPMLTAASNHAMHTIGELQSLLEKQAAAHEPTPSADTAGEQIRRLVAAPSIADFQEQPLPDGITPVEMTREQQREHRVALTREHAQKLYQFPIIRIERREASAVALGASGDYDPVGALSEGYWVFRSHDGGASWDRPIYTGLRSMMPYVARPVSKLPMIGPSGIRLEVEVLEGDPDSIAWGFSRYKRRELGLFLEIPWEILERDSDGDGLTDIAEERLITDPHRADTDRDGLDDRIDTVPHVPRTTVADDRALLMQAVLEEAHRLTKASPERTVFVVAGRADFRGIAPARRVVVLSSEEHAAAERKFGPMYPTEVRLLLINRAGNRAFAVWNASWWGGAAVFEKRGSKWVSTGRRSSWIT